MLIETQLEKQFWEVLSVEFPVETVNLLYGDFFDSM